MTTAAELPSLADAPNTRREFETIYILRPGSTNELVAEVNGKVRGIIEERGGKVLKLDNWGKRRLAYEIRKERKGIYLYWQYLAGHGVVEEVERSMRLLDDVLRFMTIKLDTDVDPEARPSEVTDETYEAAATTAADEEDMFLRHTGEEGEEGEGETAKAEGAEGEGETAKAEGAEGEKAEGEKAEGEKAEGEKAEGEKAEAADADSSDDKAASSDDKADGEEAKSEGEDK